MNNDLDIKMFSVGAFSDGAIYTFRHCCLRVLSLLLNVGLIFLLSLNKYLRWIGCVLILFRAFLLALNCTFVIIFLGMGEVLGCIFIMLPCQLVCLGCLVFIYLSLRLAPLTGGVCSGLLVDNKQVIYSVVLLIIVSLCEFLLFVIFKPTFVFVI